MEDNMKPKSVPKGKERRQPLSQEALTKRATKMGQMKTDQLTLPPPQSHENSDKVKKFLNEAKKIVKIGMEKDYALLNRENTLQNSNELVESLRKNILHLQMEYEKLDQNYQKEISHRSEVVKRMDTTKETVESMMQSSDVLTKSLKQLEADKLRIAEFYEIIYNNQKEVETKHSKVEKFIKDQDDLFKTKLETINKCHERILSQHSETVSQLTKKLNYANDKVKVIANEREELSKRIEELEKSSNCLQSLLDNERKLKSGHEENAQWLKKRLNKVQMQRSKFQKVLEQKESQITKIVRKNKNLRKFLKNKDLLNAEFSEVNKNLELKNNELERKFENLLEGEKSKIETWEKKEKKLREEASNRDSEIENLKRENKNLSNKISKLSETEKSKQSELVTIQNDLSKLLSENLKLKDEIIKCGEESDKKNKIIFQLEKKAENLNSDYKKEMESEKEERGKLREFVKKLEIEIANLREKIAIEKKEKENLNYEFNLKFDENLKSSNFKINDLKILLDEKTNIIEKLQTEQNVHNNQLQIERDKNKELTKNVETLEKTRQDLNKELEKTKKEISEYSEKLKNGNSLNEALVQTERELKEIQEEIKLKNKSFEALEEKQKMADKELTKMNKMVEENSTLKTALANSRSLLEAAEARVEAYKVVVRKLESEKVESENAHLEEVSRLKAEIIRTEEASKASMGVKTGNAITRQPSTFFMETPNKNVNQTNKKERETPQSKSKERLSDFFSQKSNVKENEPEIGEIENWQKTSTPPLQNAKKFLSTPRKIFTSTPQSNLSNVPSVEKKKRDPYDFDSDSSVEKLDTDKVLKVFSRQKRESNKRPKTKK